MVTVTDACADEVLSETERYLEAVEGCVSLLPDLLGAYGRDAGTFAATLDRLCRRESDCDEIRRELNGLLGESLPPNYTGVYLRVDDVVWLYARLDAVPNRVEQFARELDAMAPTLSAPARDHLSEMATLTVEATDRLTDAIATYVATLVTPGDRVALLDAVETIGALESECDRHKYDLLGTAFDRRPTADALVLWALLATLDAATNAVEDAAEHLAAMNSATR